MSSFPDHFSSVAANYARFRPTYPAALFDWIAAIAPAHGAVWDCGCGNGQATLPLAERFAHVVATDPSGDQIAQAPARDNIEWRVAPAEASGLADASVDAATVAQALHWFDRPAFWREVQRVVRPGGALVVWTYGMPFFDDVELTRELHHLHEDVVGPYWPVERGHVDEHYRDFDFPFERIAPPEFDMRAHWTLEQVAGYLGTWSATRRYIAAERNDPVLPFVAAVRERFGAGARDLRWPLTILAGRVSGKR